jgi:glycosyltransferase involved in cell wall biosynthesis
MTADAAGGVWTYAQELVRALRAHDVEVVVAAMGPRPPEPIDAEARWGDFALEWMDDPWEDVEAAGEWLLDLRDEVRPDLVHLNGFAHAALPWELPVAVVGHSDVASWFESVRRAAPPAAWDRYRSAVATGLAAADAVVSPTRAMLESIVRLYALACPTYVIPNARDPRLFEPLPKRPFVLGAGRLWDEAKNVAALERVAPRLSWPVELVGPRTPHEPPRAGELHERLRSASIFALPARYEPFGLAPLEAALAGCALVLGDIASLREVWGAAAEFVASDDELAGAIERLIEDDELRAARARAARRRALEYSPRRMASAYRALYSRLLAREREQVAL